MTSSAASGAATTVKASGAVAAHPQVGLEVALGVEQQRPAGRTRGEPGDVVAQQAVEEPLGVGPLHPDERGPPAHGRAGPAGAQARVVLGRGRGRPGAAHGVETFPLPPERSAAIRACCASRPAVERMSATIRRRTLSSRLSSSSCLGPAGSSKAPAMA